ncbi:MAG: hypothetical protein HXX15_17915 [Rhodopseudomonas sp.]|uniref:hypothetical protein n=1 Tax=Rhodopseudomonas sp. TaxID=1078 RepID=UPI0017B1C0B3|nr:hypothetical protein [Rhodopseudomonas sp.]NVN87958.1 hypothetical protein [Rhodopseudomonas sp.]
MPITLQSTGRGFESQFLRQLPRLEQAMAAHDLDPSNFTISKEPAVTANVPLLGPFFYDYTVLVGDDQFTITEPNDARFLEYFYDRILASDAPEPPAAPRSDGLLARLARWMTQPI